MRCAFIMLLFFVFSPCFSGENTPEKQAKVLLAYEKTDFKEKLIDAIAERLKKENTAVTIIEHSDSGLDTIDPSVYDAVFISNSGVNSKVRPWVLSWLEKYKAYRNRILLHTTQIRSWEVVAPVDVVTSASSRKKIKPLAKSYAEAVTLRYKKK